MKTKKKIKNEGVKNVINRDEKIKYYFLYII